MPQGRAQVVRHRVAECLKLLVGIREPAVGLPQLFLAAQAIAVNRVKAQAWHCPRYGAGFRRMLLSQKL